VPAGGLSDARVAMLIAFSNNSQPFDESGNGILIERASNSIQKPSPFPL